MYTEEEIRAVVSEIAMMPTTDEVICRLQENARHRAVRLAGAAMADRKDSETFTLAELKRAGMEVSPGGLDFTLDELALQVRKNRLWDANNPKG